MRRVDLVLVIENRTILSVRPAMNIDDQRMFGSRGHPDGFGQESFDFIFVVVADEGEGFHFGNLFSGEELGIQVSEFPGSIVSCSYVKFGGITRSSQAVG